MIQAVEGRTGAWLTGRGGGLIFAANLTQDRRARWIE